MDVAGKKILVVGLGRSGLSACAFLARRGAAVVGTDVKPRESFGDDIGKLEKEGVAFIFGDHDAETFGSSDMIVLSPGVPPDIKPVLAAEEAGVDILSEVELAYRFNHGILIGITGTKGKSTTTTILGHILAEAGFDARVGGNIGRPFIDLVEGSTPATVSVIELSSFQLEKIRFFRADLVLLLSLFPDHLDRYPSFEAYVAAKKNIFLNMQENDRVLVNYDDPRCMGLAGETKAEKILYSTRRELGDGFGISGEHICRFRQGRAIPLLETRLVRLKGRHSLSNVLAACAGASLLDVPPAKMKKAVTEFAGLEHCLEPVGTIAGRDFYNDSKATNAEAVREALSTFRGNVLLIMGGLDKGSDFSLLREAIGKKVKALFLIGDSSARLAGQYRGLSDITGCGSLEEAAEKAFQASAPGDTILLSPGCASFDMFTDYAHRGRIFKQAFETLKKKAGHG